MKEEGGRGGVVAPALSLTNTLGLTVGHGVLLCFISTDAAGVKGTKVSPAARPAPRTIP